MILCIFKIAAISFSPTTMLLNFQCLSDLDGTLAYLHLQHLHRLSNRVTSGQLDTGQINVYQAHIHFNDEKSTESKFLLGNIAS